MRIIFLQSSQSFGGATKSTLELAKRLQQIGHEVLIVDFWGSNSSFKEGVRKMDLSLKVLDPRSEPFIISSKNKLRYIVNAFVYFTMQRKLRREFEKVVKEFQPDIVSVRNLKNLNILDDNGTYQIDYFARGWFAYKSLTKLSKRKFKKYKLRFLTVSQSTRQAIYTGGVAKLEDIRVLNTVIPKEAYDGYQPAYQQFDASRPIKILHSGGFLPTKGQHVCLGIAEELIGRGVAFEMLLTGIIYEGTESGIYYNKILSIIKTKKLEPFVRLLINPTNIMDCFKETDLLIHPSWTEGLPRVALEALTFGKPIIANPVGGVTDVVIHGLTGYITDFNDIKQYADYIQRYFNDLEIYKSHSRIGRQLIKQNYLDQNQFDNIKRIYPI